MTRMPKCMKTTYGGTSYTHAPELKFLAEVTHSSKWTSTICWASPALAWFNYGGGDRGVGVHEIYISPHCAK